MVDLTLNKCEAKRGFFVLRDCNNAAHYQCDECGRSICTECIAENERICLECEAVNALDDKKLQGDEAYKQRHEFYVYRNFSPLYAGQQLQSFNRYDIRVFNIEMAHLTDLDDDVEGDFDYS